MSESQPVLYSMVVQFPVPSGRSPAHRAGEMHELTEFLLTLEDVASVRISRVIAVDTAAAVASRLRTRSA